MINAIIIAIFVVAVFFGVRSAVKHFQGKGSCCGGGSSTIMVEPKKLDKVAATKEITISGMKCENCSARVQNALNSLENVNASVKLKKNVAIVKTGDNVSDDLLKETVEKAGYTVVTIKNI